MPTIEIEDTLPDKLSDLLEVALSDLETESQRDDVVINMGTWHGLLSVNGKTSCQQCLAGCVMSRSLGVPRPMHANPFDFCESLASKLRAIDSLRIGGIANSFLFMNRDFPEGSGLPHEISLPSYDGPTGNWEAAMRDLVNMLREAGE